MEFLTVTIDGRSQSVNVDSIFAIKEQPNDGASLIYSGDFGKKEHTVEDKLYSEIKSIGVSNTTEVELIHRHSKSGAILDSQNALVSIGFIAGVVASLDHPQYSELIMRSDGGWVNTRWLVSQSISEIISTIADGAVSVTHAELASLISNSALITGKQYRISDFMTVHYLHETAQSVKNIEAVGLTIPVEPLIVVAADEGTLSPVAKSELHPTDYLEYTPNNAWGGNLEVVGESKGAITRRRSARFDTSYANVSTPYDFRYCVYRRWNCQELYKKTGFSDNYVLWADSVDIGKSEANASGSETWASDTLNKTVLSTTGSDGTGSINIQFDVDRQDGAGLAAEIFTVGVGNMPTSLDTFITNEEANLNALGIKVSRTADNELTFVYSSVQVAFSQAVENTPAAGVISAVESANEVTKDFVDVHSFVEGAGENGLPVCIDIHIVDQRWAGEGLDNNLANVTMRHPTTIREVHIASAHKVAITHKVYHLHGVTQMGDFIFADNVAATGYLGFSETGHLKSTIMTSKQVIKNLSSCSIHRKDLEGDNALASNDTWTGLAQDSYMANCRGVHALCYADNERIFWKVEDCEFVVVPIKAIDAHKTVYFAGFRPQKFTTNFGQSFKNLDTITTDYPAGQAHELDCDFRALKSNLNIEVSLSTGSNAISFPTSNAHYGLWCSEVNIVGDATATIDTMTGYGTRNGVVKYLIPAAGKTITVNNNDVANGFICSGALVAAGDNKEIIKCEWNPVHERWYASKS